MASAAVSEELEVLSSIFSEEFAQLSSSAFSIRLPLSSPPSVSLNLSFTLPPSYPLVPPSIAVSSTAPWLTEDVKAALMDCAHRVWEESSPEVCCYQQIEAMKQMIEDAIAATLPASAIDEPEQNAGEEEQWSDQEVDVDAVEDKAEEWQHRKQAMQSTSPAPSPSNDSTSPLTSGPPYTDRKSVFIAHLAPLSSPSALPPLLSYISSHPKLSRATHNITAYRISSPSYTQTGCDDDGEDRAGGRLLHMLEAMQASNVFICVTRYYGGIKLGPERFRIINNVARELLEREGYGGERKTEGKAKSKGRDKR